MNNLKSIEELLKEKLERLPEDKRDELIKQLKVMLGLMATLAIGLGLMVATDKYIEHIMFDNNSTDFEDEQEADSKE